MKKDRKKDPQAREKNLAKLPPMCYAVQPAYPLEIIIIKRGEQGYYTTDLPHGKTEKKAKEHVALLNEKICVPPVQVEAMLNGSICGWHVPAADPDVVAKLHKEMKGK